VRKTQDFYSGIREIRTSSIQRVIPLKIQKKRFFAKLQSEFDGSRSHIIPKVVKALVLTNDKRTYIERSL
jgi:hypothetical protein